MTSDINRLVCYNLKFYRTSLGYSQEYIAVEMGMSQNNYSRIESGKCKITVQQLQRLAEILNKKIEDLFKLPDELKHLLQKEIGVGV
jgi:transcriptional regulator with XRE-family HTH domain